MSTEYLLLTDDEANALAEMVQLIIFVETKYYLTDAKEDLDSSERIKVRNGIDKWWAFYDELKVGDHVFVLDDYSMFKDISFQLDFDIFTVLEDSDCWVDNPSWLYTVMCTWKKIDDFVRENDPCKK